MLKKGRKKTDQREKNDEEKGDWKTKLSSRESLGGTKQKQKKRKLLPENFEIDDAKRRTILAKLIFTFFNGSSKIPPVIN